MGLSSPIPPAVSPHLGRRTGGRLVVGLLGAFLVGRLLILVAAGVPPGVDGGNWLAYGRDIWTGDLLAPGLVYPPMVPTLSLVVTELAGPVAGLALLAALASVASGWVIFLTCRRAAPPARVAAAVAVALLWPPSQEVVAWGGYPQLLGSAAAIGTLALVRGFLAQPSFARGSSAVALFGATAATSHLVFLALVTALAVLMIRARRSILLIWPAFLALGAASTLAVLPLAPTYLALLGSAARAEAFHPGIGTPAAWLLPAMGLVAAGVVSIAGRQAPDRVAAVQFSWLAGVTVAWLLTGSERYAYELGPLMGLTVAVAPALPLPVRVRRPGRFTLALAAAGVLLVLLSSLLTLRASASRYQTADAGLVAAARWIADETSPDAVLAVPGVRGIPVGWWVQGLSGRSTLTGSSLEWLLFEEEREHAITVSRYFHDPLFAANAVGELGADYLVIPTGWAPPAFLPDHAQVAFRSGGTIVIELGEPPT
ncbi:MAG: hypothetical protein ACRDWA_10930 [Acidimicrobiia bacterium]